MPGTPEKQRGAVDPEIGKKNNQWLPNILLFPLIPTKARTTKLAQKLENTQNQLKPCSASGLLRGNLFKDTILTLLDPIWFCWADGVITRAVLRRWGAEAASPTGVIPPEETHFSFGNFKGIFLWKPSSWKKSRNEKSRKRLPCWCVLLATQSKGVLMSQIDAGWRFRFLWRDARCECEDW